jgi:hypothetical protein
MTPLMERLTEMFSHVQITSLKNNGLLIWILTTPSAYAINDFKQNHESYIAHWKAH